VAALDVVFRAIGMTSRAGSLDASRSPRLSISSDGAAEIHVDSSCGRTLWIVPA